jgi:SHAQKYF class myb-like DNA-binding protein
MRQTNTSKNDQLITLTKINRVPSNNNKKNEKIIQSNEKLCIIPNNILLNNFSDEQNKTSINSSSDSSPLNIYNASSEESKYSLNPKDDTDIINNNNQKKNFLGKKRKIYFNIDNYDKKPNFITNTNIFRKSNKFFDKKVNGLLKNPKILTSINSTEINTKKVKSKNNKKIFNTFDYNILDGSNPDDKTGKEEGRWTYEEHLKFIEAIIKYGKKWKDIQNYIGSRCTSQIRSHAQKFFIKLKKMKENKFNYNFDGPNINSLFDIINILIEKNNKSDTEIKNILISLSKILTKKEKKKLFIINNTLKEKEPIIEINSKEINDKYDSIVIEINNDLNNNNKEEDTKQNLKGDESGKENNIEEKLNIDLNFDEAKNSHSNNIVFDEDNILSLSESELFYLENINQKTKGNLYKENVKSPYLTFIFNFFS